MSKSTGTSPKTDAKGLPCHLGGGQSGLSASGAPTLSSPPKDRPRHEILYLLRSSVKLGWENHAAWDMLTRRNLAGEDLDGFLNGLYPLDRAWTHDEQKRWSKLDSFVMFVLLNSMDNELVTIVADCTSTASIWSTIRRQFSVSGSSGLINVIVKLVTVPYILISFSLFFLCTSK